MFYFTDSMALPSCVFYYCQMEITSHSFAFSSFYVQLVEIWVTKLLPLYVLFREILFSGFFFFPLLLLIIFKYFYIPMPGPMVIKPALIRDVVNPFSLDGKWEKPILKWGGNPSVVNGLLLMAILLLCNLHCAFSSNKWHSASSTE